MAWKVVWTEQAWHDLESVAAFIAKDSPYYAATFVREIRDAARSLKDFAERGRIVPEVGQAGIRELLIGNYRLIYEIAQQQVAILTFVHGARDFSTIWSAKTPG